MGMTVPLDAGDSYKNAFASLARMKKTTMSKLVREALDAAYGDELKPYLSFFESDVDQNQHLEKSGNHGES